MSWKVESLSRTLATSLCHACPSKSEPVHFLQIWLQPNAMGVEPGYAQKHFPVGQRRGGWVLLVSPDGRDDSIAAHADQETLYDQPQVAKDKLRITGSWSGDPGPSPLFIVGGETSVVIEGLTLGPNECDTAGAVVNNVFGIQNMAPPFMAFEKENQKTIQDVLKDIPTMCDHLRIPLTDALRMQFLCDNHEGVNSESVLERAGALNLLILERDVPMPGVFMSIVRSFGVAYKIIEPLPKPDPDMPEAN